ncbi:hypothetical protein C0J52_01392 [Blattella germanica]|nr:hypothetical protein C0J52_01392 [Blattella germanica]
MGNLYFSSVLLQKNVRQFFVCSSVLSLWKESISLGGYVQRPVLFQNFSLSSSKTNYYKSSLRLPTVRSSHCIHLKTVRQLSNQTNFQTSKDIASNELETNIDAVCDKILFNSVLEYKKLSWQKKKILQKKQNKLRLSKINEKDPMSNIPVALKYLEQSTIHNDSVHEEETERDLGSEVFCFPYSIQTDVEKQCDNDVGQPSIQKYKDPDELLANMLREQASESVGPSANWLSDYECYDELDTKYESNERPWELNYGTPNDNIPSSNVPCGGCGALLHCRDPAIPGYIPSEIFENQDQITLRSIVCQRCHFMRQYDTALNVIISPDEYPKLMAHIKEKMALIVLMVDLLDFPCSIWPEIMNIIGRKQPVVLVGNKVDLLPPDSRGYLHRIKECLVNNLNHSGIPERNIKHVALISAKTGYGVEELITKLHNIWEYKGDVYLLGCTNVGKSTLFNALLQSDFCKFPILRPAGWRLYERTKRLLAQQKDIRAERTLRYMQLQQNASSGNPALIGHIGMTFHQKKPEEQLDPFSMNRRNVKEVTPLSGIDPSDEAFQKSKWCYDTPGVVHPDQVIHLLTTEELMLTLPKKILLPRTFRLSPNMSLFIAGLGRLDYVEGNDPIRMTVFSSGLLPITICKTDDAEELYRTLLGSQYLTVPCGGQSRLAQWPGLQSHPQIFELEGISAKESSGDVILSSAGWIALTLRKGKQGTFRGWTPYARGVYLRKPSLLPFAVNLCGPKVRSSPAYCKGKAVYKVSN